MSLLWLQPVCLCADSFNRFNEACLSLDLKPEPFAQDYVHNSQDVKAQDMLGLSTQQHSIPGHRLLSCSDKIARWNVLGLQGKTLAQQMSPVYLNSITIGRKFNRPHAERAFCCRLEACKPEMLHAATSCRFRINHPTVMCTAVKLDSRVMDADAGASFTSNECFWWCASGNQSEWILGKEGRTKDGKDSALCTVHLAEMERAALASSCNIQDRMDATSMSAAYTQAKKWLYRKHGLFEQCCPS